MKNTTCSAAQEAAIRHGSGPAMVIAGPGSGKTYVITNRLNYLISDLKVEPSSILTITFTKAASQEMKSRAAGLLGSNAAAVTFGTFHAVFFSILRHTYHLTADNIIRNDTRRMLIKNIIHDLKIETNDPGVLINEIISEISCMKNTGNTADFKSGILDDGQFEKVYEIFTRRMKELRLLDFDDMLIKCRELFEKRPEILRLWQRKYQWLQVDEFQDINSLQYDVVKMLAAPENNLFIVGDDDQSIYGFRGSEPGIMKTFTNDFDGAAVYPLGMNYRSVHCIVEAASAVIAENRDRLDKEFSAFNMTGDDIALTEYDDREKECESIIDTIRQKAVNGNYDAFALLTRTNQLAGFFAEKFSASSIPYRTKEKLVSIYDTFVAGDILDYCRIADGDRTRSTFYHIMNRPQRFISRSAVSSEKVDMNELRAYYSDSFQMTDALGRLEWDITQLSSMKPFTAVHFILYGIGYMDHLKKYAAEHKCDFRELENTALEIKERARGYNSFKNWFRAIAEFDADKDKGADEGKPAVSIMTMHASKGLEFEEVFIPDINEGIIPYHKAVLESEIEEERRLFYVGMTRAEKKLHLSSIKSNYGKNMQPSRFTAKLISN